MLSRICGANLTETVVLACSASMRDRIAMYNTNALKLGIFGANCSSGRSATKLPERWSASWPDCLRLARMADEAGIDFMLPIGRWKGYGGDTDFHGSTLETVTWAVGLLSATQHMTVFGTVHAPLFHPLIAAKEFGVRQETSVLCGECDRGLSVRGNARPRGGRARQH